MGRKLAISLILVLLVGPMMTAQAATNLPAGFVEALIDDIPGSPTAMEFAPDGRLFVLDQGGAVYIIKNGTRLPDPFMDINVDNDGERGLLGIAFDPNFSSNQFIYFYYTTPSKPHNRVSRFTADGDTVVPNSELVILNLPTLDPNATNHNGGAIHFGLDGKLYVAVGENAHPSNSQNVKSLLGKMLRINPNGTFPSDNPFYGLGGNARAVWALGLRNPYTFAVNSNDGTIYINDVGQDTWEEINLGTPGANYGWPNTNDGDFDPDDFDPDDFTGTLTPPLYAYPHSGTCAITGGTFYNPVISQFPETYTGKYLFTDYCGDWIHMYDPVGDSTSNFATNMDDPTIDLKVSPDGSLYYLDVSSSEIFAIMYASGNPPFFTKHPNNLMVTVGDDATFSCDTSDAGATYKWQRDNGGGFADIGGATSKNYAVNNTVLGDSGAVFHCIAHNAIGDRTSHDATLTVVLNQPPVPHINLPSAALQFKAGTKVTFTGSATDPEDGNLPASAFTWKVDLYHYPDIPPNAHTHPAMPDLTGTTKGTFTIPNGGETSPNIWYRFTLTVEDGDGNQISTTRDIYPLLTTLNFDSAIPNLDFALDDLPQTLPYSVDSVVGMMRKIEVPAHVEDGGKLWQFRTWKPGGGAIYNFKAPTQATTYLALYQDLSILNGSFEIDVNNDHKADKWKLSKLTSADQVVCDLADTGSCSMHLLPGSMDKLVYQILKLKGSSGDTYSLDFSTQGLSASANSFTVQLIMTNKDHTTTEDFVDLTPPDGSWSDQTLTVTSTKAYTSLKIIITANAGAAGQAWFDSFMLSFN